MFQVIAADAGTADSVVGTLTFTGGTNINTRVSDNRITIHMDSAVTNLQSLTVDNLNVNRTASITSGARKVLQQITVADPKATFTSAIPADDTNHTVWH